MHQYAVSVAAWDVLEVGDVLDGRLKAVLFSFRTSKEKVC